MRATYWNSISSMTRPPLTELAAQLVLLQEQRPAKTSTEPVDAYRLHMHEEYLLYEEMLARIGIDRTIELIDQAKKTLQLMTPG